MFGRIAFGELFFSFGMCSFSNQKLELQRGPTSPRQLLHLLNSLGCAVFISTCHHPFRVLCDLCVLDVKALLFFRVKRRRPSARLAPAPYSSCPLNSQC